jgi:hypothetical protein
LLVAVGPKKGETMGTVDRWDNVNELEGGHIGVSGHIIHRLHKGDRVVVEVHRAESGETVPEAEDGWETVAAGTQQVVGMKRSDGAIVPLPHPALEHGDSYRVQVRRAPKPKTAVLMRADVVPGKSITKPVRRWFCGACHDFLSERHVSPGEREPTECPNCGAHFTETKDL